jgi:taurine dioxygenase
MLVERPRPNDTAARPFALHPLAPLMAAEVLDLDLRRPVDDGLRDAVLDAFNRDHVLVFRDQHLNKAEQVAFTQRFGEMEPHVNADFRGHEFPHLHVVNNLDPDGRPSRAITNRGNYAWHTDKSYMAVPSLATLLFAIEVPPEGGDTEFADMQAAYDALDGAMKARIAGLRMVHSWERSRQKSGSKPATEQEKRAAPPVVHPLVRVHPATGAKSLYIGTHASHVEGRPIEDGERLLKELQDFATQERFIYRHRWRPGDLVMWDNRCLLHRATDTYDMDKHRRILHRTVVRGSVPV